MHDLIWRQSGWLCCQWRLSVKSLSPLYTFNMNQSIKDVAKRSSEHKTAIRGQDSESPGQLRETVRIKDSLPPLQENSFCLSYCKRCLYNSFPKKVGIRIKQIKRPSEQGAEVDRKKRNPSSIGTWHQKLVNSCGEKLTLHGQLLGSEYSGPASQLLPGLKQKAPPF